MDLAGPNKCISLDNFHFLVNLGLQKYSNIPLVPPKGLWSPCHGSRGSWFLEPGLKVQSDSNFFSAGVYNVHVFRIIFQTDPPKCEKFYLSISSLSDGLTGNILTMNDDHVEPIAVQCPGMLKHWCTISLSFYHSALDWWLFFMQQKDQRRAFGNIREDNKFSDVTLACEDGQKMEAHRLILVSISPLVSEQSDSGVAHRTDIEGRCNHKSCRY